MEKFDSLTLEAHQFDLKRPLSMPNLTTKVRFVSANQTMMPNNFVILTFPCVKVKWLG